MKIYVILYNISEVIEMKFEENLRELRKQRGMSQEELAEQLNISRQSVSKWENGSAYPELDKLMQLCELFQCKIDDLLYGEVKEQGLLHKDVYDKHENQMSKMMTLGVMLILFGAASYCYMEAIFIGRDEYMADMIFMFFVMIAVMIFVYYGISHSHFQKKYQQIPQNIYDEYEKDRIHKHFQIGMVIGVGLILFGVFAYLMLEEILEEPFANGFFMTLITIAVGIFVYCGMQKSKIEKTELSKQIMNESDQRIGKWCGCIMMITFAMYLLWSFVWNAWSISWVLFPLGGIMCGIVSILLSKDQ